MIDLVGITLLNESKVILKDFDLKVRTGEIIGLLGLSGSGKSHILSLASGALVPKKGRMRLEGCDVTNQRQKLKEATALSTPEILGPYHLSVDSWLEYWLSLYDVPNINQVKIDVLNQLELNDIHLTLVKDLSLGQRRMLDIARLIAIDPKIYLLDSPDIGLDGKAFRKLIKLIRSLSDKGKTVIIATNFPSLPIKSCTRCVEVKNGQIVEEKRAGTDGYSDFISKAQGWV
jgi:ABC-type multidrug transport system ATPase subunit